MKKITLLIAFLSILSWQANAQFTEDFEGTFLPTGWAKELPDASNDITQSTTVNHTVAGANSARFSSYNSSTDYNQYLFTQQFTVTAPNTELRFWHQKSNADPELLEWGVSTTTQTSGAVSTWTPVTLTQSVWVEEIVDLSAYVGQTIYFSFHYYGNYLYYVYLDDVSLSSPPSCPDPSALTTTNLTTTSADLGWTENGTATTWDIEWGANGFAPTGTPTITGTTTNPHNLTGLTANTSYDFYVRADCGGSGASTWVGPFTFFTGYCTPSSSGSATYVDDFSTTNGSANISNLTSGFTTGGYFDGTAQSVQSFATGSFDFNAAIVGGTAGFSIWVDWNNDLVFDDATEKVFNTTAYANGPFTGTITIPGGTAIGNYRMRITTDWNASNPALPCDARTRAEFEDYTITVTAPPSCVPPSALTAANITTTSADLGWTENGTATTWDIEWGTAGFAPTGTPTITGTTTNPHNLTGLTSATSYDFYVRADCGGSGASTWVGPFNFTTPVSCPAPSALTATNITATSADLGWTENGTATTWDIEWGANGFVPTGTPTITGTTTNPHNLTGLTAVTSYDFYVRADCGGSGASTWTGPFTFITPCATYTPNYLENFTTFIPTCWDEADAGDAIAGPSSLGASPWAAGTAIGATAKINLYTTTRSDWLLSPMFDLSSGGYELAIDVAVTDWNGSTADAMGSDDTVRVLYTEDGINWNNLITWTVADALPNNLTNFVIAIPSTGNNVQFGILATDGPVNDAEDYDFHVDSFEIRTPVVLCPVPTNLTSNNITNTTVDLGWTENGTATTWDIEWGATGFVPTGTPTITGTTTNPHNLTGLTANTTYDFYVRADCGGSGTSTWSSVATFSTLNVGINSYSGNVNLNVYPNPNKGVFTLNVNTTDVNELEIKVMNLQGQVVFIKNNFDNISKVNEKVDLSNNAKGLYFVTVTSDKGIVTHKIVVQ